MLMEYYHTDPGRLKETYDETVNGGWVDEKI